MIKQDIENHLKHIFTNEKHFIGNLFKGNERCIQGDLYAEISRNAKDVYLEFPIPYNKSREHLDIAQYDYINDIFPFIIELKHYSPNVNLQNFVQNAMGSVNGDISKRRQYVQIQDFFIVLIITEIICPFNKNVTNHPFVRTYAKNQDITRTNSNSTALTNLNNALLQIDQKLIYNLRTNSNHPDIKIHTYILQVP